MDCLTGPDGAVYVADWYDKRANHVDPVDNWDKTTGRIYKIAARGETSGSSQYAELGSRALARRRARNWSRCCPNRTTGFHARPAASSASGATPASSLC